MLSKNKQKTIRALAQKKGREEQQLFIAEGNKLVADLLPAFDCAMLLAKSSWMATQGDLPVEELLVAEEDDIKKVSLLKSPQDVFALFRIPKTNLSEADPTNELILALDDVQDPGNLGTIIRIADWYGIRHIVCNTNTVDAFNPKVVQATMGALARVQVHYTDLSAYLTQQKERNASLYGTFLDGSDMYATQLTPTGIIVMGNEGNGIRPEIDAIINNRLFIPSFPPDQPTSESLNVAIATAIVCAEFRRVELKG